MEKVNRFIRTSFTFFLGSVLSKITIFLMLPLYTKEFSPKEFGEYDLIVTIISFASPIIFFQIWDGMFRYSFDRTEIQKKHDVISNSFFVLIIGTFLYSIVYLLISMTFEYDYKIWIFLYGLMVAFQYQYTFISRSFMKNDLFIWSGLVNTIITTFLNLLLILKFNIGIESLYISTIIGSLFQIIMIEISLNPLKMIKIKSIDKDLQISMIKFSVPLCIASASYWLLSGYTKIVINQNLGDFANGLYAVALRLTSILMLLVTVLQYAWNEMAYIMAGENNKVKNYILSVEFFFKAIMVGSGIFLLVIKILFPYAIGYEYQNAYIIIPIVLIGLTFNSFSNFIGTIFMAEKKTSWILKSTLLASFFNVIILWMLPPFFGLTGSLTVLSISFLIIILIRMYILKVQIGILVSLPYVKYTLFLTYIVFVYYIFNSLYIIIFHIIMQLILLFNIVKFSLLKIKQDL